MERSRVTSCSRQINYGLAVSRLAMLNTQPFPPPSVTPRQQAAPGGKKYETSEWILQGYAWETLPVMDKDHEDFNKEFGTDFKFPLRSKEEGAK